MVFAYDALYKAQAGKCFYCGRSINSRPFVPKSRSTTPGLPKPNTQGRTRDHFLPRVQGFNCRANVVLACEPCNRGKGHKTPSRDVCVRFDMLMRNFRVFGDGSQLPDYWQEFREHQAFIDWFKKVFLPIDLIPPL